LICLCMMRREEIFRDSFILRVNTRQRYCLESGNVFVNYDNNKLETLKTCCLLIHECVFFGGFVNYYYSVLSGMNGKSSAASKFNGSTTNFNGRLQLSVGFLYLNIWFDFCFIFWIQNFNFINKIIMILWNQNIKKFVFMETYNFLSYLF